MTNIANLPDDLGSQLQFYISTNADFRTAFQFTDTSGAPIDLTGIDFYAQVRSSLASSAVVLNLSTTNGGIVCEPQLGQLVFAVPMAKPSTGATNHTSLLAPGTAIMDLVAKAGTILKNVCEKSGPATVTITKGITDTTI